MPCKFSSLILLHFLEFFMSVPARCFMFILVCVILMFIPICIILFSVTILNKIGCDKTIGWILPLPLARFELTSFTLRLHACYCTTVQFPDQIWVTYSTKNHQKYQACSLRNNAMVTKKAVRQWKPITAQNGNNKI